MRILPIVKLSLCIFLFHSCNHTDQKLKNVGTDLDEHSKNFFSDKVLDYSQINKYVGSYSLLGSDLSFPVEDFQARQSYEGHAKIYEDQKSYWFELTFDSPDSKITSVQNKEFLFKAKIVPNRNHLSGVYVITGREISGFGTINIIMNDDGASGRGYTVFESNVNDKALGMTQFSLNRTQE